MCGGNVRQDLASRKVVCSSPSTELSETAEVSNDSPAMLKSGKKGTA